MRIDVLELQNFKKFESLRLDLNSHFTLLAGDNGSGKTSILDALAVASAIWLEAVGDPLLANSKRGIRRDRDVRMVAEKRGDRTQFQAQLPAAVTAHGRIGDGADLKWTRQIKSGGAKTSNAGADPALKRIRSLIKAGPHVVMPVLAYYGAGRAWLSSNQPSSREKPVGANRWAAFYYCFDEKIRFGQMNDWFRRETTAAGSRGGKVRPGFEVVRRAVLRFVPGADALWFDPDLDQIVLSIDGAPQPFLNLSAGQRVMLALAADIAIKAVTQNAHLLPAEHLGPDEEPLPQVLRETNGIVLIDELDVHLHPVWQRHVAADLKDTFPKIQFVCTSHSPQIIGQLAPEEIRVLSDSEPSRPLRSFGMESGRVLEEVMGAKARDPETAKLLGAIDHSIEIENLGEARQKADQLRHRVGPDDPDLARVTGVIDFIEDDVAHASDGDGKH